MNFYYFCLVFVELQLLIWLNPVKKIQGQALGQEKAELYTLYPTERAMLYQCCSGLDREIYLIRFELVFNLANFVFVVPVLLKEQWCVLLL